MFKWEWNRGGKRKTNINQAEGKEGMQNTWEMRREKQTKGEISDLAPSFGKTPRERKGEQRRIEKQLFVKVSRLLLSQQRALLCDTGDVIECHRILLLCPALSGLIEDAFGAGYFYFFSW